MYEKRLTDRIARITGIPELVCDLAQLRSPVTQHVLELIAFQGPETDFPSHERAPLRPGAAHVAFVVENLEQTLERIEGFGAVRLGEITTFDACLAVYCREPGGSFIELEELFES